MDFEQVGRLGCSRDLDSAESALEMLPSVRTSHAEMTVIHCYGFINFSLN